jgi:hypothetical protein
VEDSDRFDSVEIMSMESFFDQMFETVRKNEMNDIVFETDTWWHDRLIATDFRSIGFLINPTSRIDFKYLALVSGFNH